MTQTSDSLPDAMRDVVARLQEKLGYCGQEDERGYATAIRLIEDALRSAALVTGAGERVRHVKRGTEYEVLGEAEALVSGGRQNESDRFGDWRGLYDGDKVTVYRCVTTGELLCCLADEARSGRCPQRGLAKSQGGPSQRVSPRHASRNRSSRCSARTRSGGDVMSEDQWISFETKQALKNLDEYIVYAEKSGWISSAKWAREAALEIRCKNTAGSPESRLAQIRRQYLENPGDMTTTEVLTAIRNLATYEAADHD